MALLKNEDVNLRAISSDRFAKDSGINPQGLMNDSATFQGNPSSICWDINTSIPTGTQWG